MALALACDGARHEAVLLLQALANFVVDGLRLRGLCPVQTTKKSVYEHTGRMSRMTTSAASFSWARAAILRAWSMGVSGLASPASTLSA